MNYVETIIDTLASHARSERYYNKIRKKSVLVYMDFYVTNNCVAVIKWLQQNVRNISLSNTRPYGTAWWPIKNQEGRIVGFGFKDPAHAVLFKLSGLYRDT